MAIKICPKCDGTGFIQVYGHVQNGRCFKCGGAGAVVTNAKDAKINTAARAEERAYLEQQRQENIARMERPLATQSAPIPGMDFLRNLMSANVAAPRKESPKFLVKGTGHGSASMERECDNQDDVAWWTRRMPQLGYFKVEVTETVSANEGVS